MTEDFVNFLYHQVVPVNQVLVCAVHEHACEPPVAKVQWCDMFYMREVDEAVLVRVLDLGGYGDVVDVADELLQELAQLDAVIALQVSVPK